MHIGRGTKSIGEKAFAGCNHLSGVFMETGLLVIGDLAFYECESLSSIQIPDTVITIGWSAFGRCDSLTSIRIPDSVEEIGRGVFADCELLSSVSLSPNIKVIPEYAFENTPSLKNIHLHEGIAEIGEGAFQESGIEYVMLPASLQYLREECFVACDHLKYVHCLSERVQVEDYSFYYCPQLRAIGARRGSTILPYAIGSGIPFEDISLWSDSQFHLDGDIAYLQFMTKDDLESRGREGDSTYETLALYGDVLVPWYNATADCPILRIGRTDDAKIPDWVKAVRLPLLVEEIHAGSFENAKGLERVSSPGTIRKVERFAFNYCLSLSEVSFLEDLEFIGEGAFEFTSLKNARLTNAVSIASDAFSYADIVDVTLGNKLIYLGENAFYGNELVGIHIPGSINTVYKSVFGRYDESTLRWVIAEEGVNVIEDGAFKNNVSDLQDVVLSSTVVYAAIELFSGQRDIWIYNKNMVFPEDDSLMASGAVIHGYWNSTAAAFANTYHLEFHLILNSSEEETILHPLEVRIPGFPSARNKTIYVSIESVDPMTYDEAVAYVLDKHSQP